jgi:hypothetical protein
VKKNRRRKKRRNETAIKARKKMSETKITLYCEYCKTNHTIRENSYKINLKKNNNIYVCKKEAISRPKPRKVKKINPYAVDGKKQCNECKQILVFECFGKDIDKKDGYSTRCKQCRNNKNNIEN